MKKTIEVIKEMGVKGIIAWFKRLFLAVSLLEFIAYTVYWLISVGAISKLVLIGIPVTAVFIAAIDTIVQDKDEEIEDEEIEEEEDEEEEIA